MGWEYVIAGTQLLGGMQGARAAKKQAAIAKRVGQMNANLINLETQVNVARLRQQVRKLVGTQATLYAKGGVLSREGSAYDVAVESQVLAEQDVLLMRYEGKIRANIARLGGTSEASRLGYAGAASLLQGSIAAIQTVQASKSQHE